MNYRPSVTPQGAGRYRAEGLMFHMPGRWELVFEWRDAARRHAAADAVAARSQ